MVTLIFNPSTQEAEAGRSAWVWGQPDLYIQFQVSLGNKANTIPPKTSMKILLIIYLVVNSYLEYKKEFKKINAHTNQPNQQTV